MPTNIIRLRGDALAGGGRNDTTFPELRRPGQYREASNIRVLSDGSIEKAGGRELITTLEQARSIISPEERAPYAEFTTAKTFVFRNDVTGATWTASVPAGKYYTHAELAAALTAAFNTACGSNSWLWDSSESQSVPSSARTGLIGKARPALAADIGAGDLTFQLDMGATGRTIADYGSGAGEFHVIYLGGEEIAYETVADLGGGILEFTLPSVTRRGYNGTIAAAHTAGGLAVMAYSAASTAYRATYVFMGRAADNKVQDENGLWVAGYVIST